MNFQHKIISNYREAFDIKKGEVISLVGGGGKTTLMFALARELSSAGRLVVTTTTTRIFEPLPSQTQVLYLDSDEDKIIDWIKQNTGNYNHVTVASKKLSSGKLAGIDAGTAIKISKLTHVTATIVEADGASRKPLKAPNATEPVIPGNTSLVVPVVGIDALGRPLTQNYVFRPEIASALTGLPLGETVTYESIAVLVTHEQGLTKGSPAKARIIPYINKVDAGLLQKAIQLAEVILAEQRPVIDKVVIGQAAMPEAQLHVISLKAVQSN
jgi:probable selenium-dependent hydroxylase accessory protein YqeC